MIKLKIVSVWLIAFLFASNKNYCQANADTVQKNSSSTSIVNTTWTGTDSEGDFYEYTFLEGGRVSYKTNTSRSDTVQFNDAEDMWFQNGSNIVILLGDTSVQKGIVNDFTMEGLAWNVGGRRWTWKLKRKLKE
jgi:hypothetical protein